MTPPAASAHNGTPQLREALGESEAFLEFQEALSRVARVDRPVLIVGERGTGKELAAARLHYLSSRWEQPLVALNCAALPASLIESELFGYEPGAFTGAARRREGRFEAADRGTLFLDEIGHLPPDVQIKILRVVEYQRFERVGSSAPTQVDVRIVGATNADLPAMAAAGRFQQDLLDRLSFEVVRAPALRERHGDIALLARYFASRMARELGWPEPPEIAEESMQALAAHDWPGNVRELKNVVERAVYRSDGVVVREVVFDPFAGTLAPRRPVTAPPEAGVPVALNGESLPERVAGLERELLQAALTETRYNQKQAAVLLGLTYHQFRGLYRKHMQGKKE